MWAKKTQQQIILHKPSVICKSGLKSNFLDFTTMMNSNKSYM